MLLIVVIAFFVNNQVIVPDIMESRNIITAREMVYDGHWMIPTMNGDLRLEKPPLPTWLAALAEMAAPDNIALQRGMAGLAALLLVFYFYRFAARVLRTDPLVPTLLLCTCYNVVLMGRTASWDIYCHAFMMGGIYHLALALQASGCRWRSFVTAGVWMGLSFMSKGPVSLYALFLPFLLACIYLERPSARGKWPGVLVMVVLALGIGSWWYAYVHLFHAEALTSVIAKESGSWVNRNVRPWYYYWKFFLETGAWSLLMLTAIFLPLFDKKQRTDKKFVLPLLWMLLSLVLLSLLPEKKSRYLLPLLIPASYVMGYLLTRWRVSLQGPDALPRDRRCFRLNAWLLTLIVALLPVAAGIFLYKPGYLSLPALIGITLFAECIAAGMGLSAHRLKATGMLWGVTILFAGAECFVLPCLRNVINNPEMKSIGLTRQLEQLEGVPFYYNEQDELRIELVYAAHRNIRPMDAGSVEALKEKLPCAILTHKRAGEELPAELWGVADSLYIDCYDDNRRPKGNRRYSDMFIYHVTLLTPKNQPE